MDVNREGAAVDGGPAELEAAADELYALPPREFVAARTAMEKAARASGRRDLAAAIKGLAKPSAAAALVNLLARAHPGEVRALLALGEELREATAARDGPRLRELSAQRNKQVGELLALARRLAADGGLKVTDDTARGVEESLRSAVADPASAELLAAARLTDVLEQSGFPGLPAPDGPPPTAAAALPTAATAKPAAGGRAAEDAGKAAAREAPPAKADPKAHAASRRLQEAQRRLEVARADAEAAAAELDDARALLEARSAELVELDERVGRARAELEAAEGDRRRAAGNERRAQAQLATAERAARASGRRLDDATAAVERAAAEADLRVRHPDVPQTVTLDCYGRLGHDRVTWRSPAPPAEGPP